jgi:YesN/AraC family two-component response regulator
MPGFDGHELARRMKEQRPDIKVVIVSGEHEGDFPPQAKSHDCALLKPAAPDALLEKVGELIQQLLDSKFLFGGRNLNGQYRIYAVAS